MEKTVCIVCVGLCRIHNHQNQTTRNAGKRRTEEKTSWKLERLEISQLYDGSDIVLVLRNLKPLQGVSSVRPLKANLDKDVDRVLKR